MTSRTVTVVNQLGMFEEVTNLDPSDIVDFAPAVLTILMTAIDDCDIFEVSTPELHDVVRLEDRYGREDKKG